MTRRSIASLGGFTALLALAACSSSSGSSGNNACSGSACADGAAGSDASKGADARSGSGEGGSSHADGGSSHPDGATPKGDGGAGTDATTGSDSGHGHDGSSGTNDSSTSGPDGTTAGNDGSSSGNDAHGVPEAGGVADGGSSTQGACTAGAVRCSPGNLVESCNSSGTAWLYDEACAAGCANGLCTGACTPGTTRCSGASSQTCNAGGTAYAQTTSCTTFCSTATGTCAVSPVQITTNTTMDGVVVVDGDFNVFPNATLTSPTGNLTIYAKTITVQQGGSIVASPTGQNPLGTGGNYSGGGYGTHGNGPYGGATFGSATDSDVAVGAAGGTGTVSYPGGGGLGGGVIRLFASTITIQGSVTANGQAGTGYGGGGSGGGILVGGNSVTVSGLLSATGGAGGASESGSTGGNGRLKVLSGSTVSVTGTLSGAVTQGLLPPIPLTSTTHPDPTQTYNDNFATFDFSWAQPFPSVQGYYLLGSQGITVPTPANAQFSSKEFLSLPEHVLPGYDGADGGVDAGPGTGSYTFFFQAVPVSATSSVGTVETVFPIHVNATPPTVASSSHPSQTTWYANTNPYFSWTFPVADSALTESYYVFDHYGSTVPTTSATLLPISQKNLLLSNVAAGVWVFHVISRDTRGYFTKVAGSYRVNIGADPGQGSLVGQVVDATSKPVVGATVTVNRGLYTTTTNSSGTYNFSQIPVATWEVKASYAGQNATANAAVTVGGTTTTNLTL